MSALRYISVVVLVILISAVAPAQIQSAATGNWNAGPTWAGGIVPGATDSAVILSGHTVTLNAAASLIKLTINSGGTLSVPATQSLTGDLVVNGVFTSTGTTTVTINGNITVDGPSANFSTNSNSTTIVGTAGKTFTLGNGATFQTSKNANPFTGVITNVTWVIDNSIELTTIKVKNSGTTSIVNPPNGQAIGNLQLTTSAGADNKTFALGANLTILGNLVIACANTGLTGPTTWNFGAFNITTSGTGKTITVSQLTSTVAVIVTGTGSSLFNGFSSASFVPPSNANFVVNYASTTGTQNIAGGTYQKLMISGGGAKSLTGSITVNDTLWLSNGIVTTSNASLLTIGSSGAITGGGSTSFVNGPIARSWSTSTATKTFPIGKGTAYRPLDINLTTPASPVIRAEMFNANAGGSSALTSISTVRYYQTSLLSGTATSDGTVKVTYGADDNVSDYTVLRVAQSTAQAGTYVSIGKLASDATSVTSESYDPAGGDYLLIGTEATGGAEPTVQASSAGITNATAGSFDLSWTNGDGTNRLVLVKAAGAVDSDPVDNATYTASTTFGSGSQIGTGNYVVYKGTGNSVTVSGLSSTTTYYVAIYEYNGTAGGENYLVSSPATANGTTLTPATEPSTPASNVVFSNATATSVDISWTNGDGSNRAVLIKSGGAVSSNPGDGASLTASTTFGSGTLVGSGNYVVYNGTGNSVSVTGLTVNTTYYVAVYEFNGSAGTENYLATTPATGNFITPITSTANGNWDAGATWVGGVVPSSSTDVVIASGHTVTVTVASTSACRNLTVNNGGILTANGADTASTALRYIKVYGTSVSNNNAGANSCGTGTDGLSIDVFAGGTVTFSGSTMKFAKIRAGAITQNSTVVIAGSVLLGYQGAALQLQNATGQNITTVNVNAGATLSTAVGSDLTTASSTNTNVSDFAPTININGTVTVERNVTMRSSFGSPSIVVTSPGTFTVNGILRLTTTTYTNPGVVSGTGSFILGPVGTLELATASGMNSSTGLIRSASRTFPTTASYSFVGTSAQVTGVDFPSPVGRFTVNNAAGVTLSNDVQVDTTLTMAKGSILDDGYVVTFGAAGILAYSDSTAQTTSDVELPAVNGPANLSVNKNAAIAANIGDLTLHASRAVSGTLTLTKGNLVLGANTLTLGTSVSGGSTSSHVVTDGAGVVSSTLGNAGSLVLPVGYNATTYNPVTVTNTSGGSATYTARVLSGITPAGNAVTAAGLDRTWDLTGTGQATLAFTWYSTEAGPTLSGSPVDGRAWKYDGVAEWQQVGGTTAVGTPNVTTVTDVSSFSRWTVGVSGGLPVQVVNVTATATRTRAQIAWTTKSEVNAAFFTIERREISETGWTSVGEVKAAGTSNAERQYAFADAGVAPGRYTYRVKAVDNDGSFAYFGNAEVAVGLAPKELTLAEAYPNPFNPTTNIEFTVAENGPVSLKIYNVVGQQVATLFSGIATAERIYQVSFDAKHLPSGLYFARLETGGKGLVKKLVLAK